MSYEAKKLTGRGYRITDGYCTELTIRYQVLTPRLVAAPGLGDLTGFPAIGAAPSVTDCTNLTLATGVVLCDVDVSEDDSGIKWTFGAVYKVPSAGAGGGGTGAGDANATQFSTRITHGTRIIEMESDHDFSNPPRRFVNSAGQPYGKAPLCRFPVRLIRVEKYLKSKVSVSGASGRCNSTVVMIDGETFAPGTAILDATCETTGDKKWPWKLSFSLEELLSIDEQGHNTGQLVHVINSGYMCKKQVFNDEEPTLELARIMVPDENGKDCWPTNELPLADDGTLLDNPTDPSQFTSKAYNTVRLIEFPWWVSA